MLRFIRSAIYEIFINLWGMIIPIIYFPAFFDNSRKIADSGALCWSRFAIWTMKKVCGINYEVRGAENLPKDGQFIIACKHQSMWETIIMHLIVKRPAYAYKKELLRIPFYGWFLTKMTGVEIDRKGGAKALKLLLAKSKKYISEGHPLIIFPQGTRTPIGSNVKDYPYHSGIIALYSHLKVPVVPAALNSGLYAPKKGLKKPGTIIIEFMKPISPGLSKDEFLKILEEKIETKSAELAIIAKH